MSGLISITIILFIAGAWLISISIKIRHSFATTASWQAWAHSAAGFFALLGICGFLGMALLAMGGGGRLPKSFEWPPGYVREVVLTDWGLYLVPLEPVGRLQIYDRNLRFVRGWQVDASGGAFHVIASQPGRIEVYTARGRKHFVFSEAGDLLASGRVAENEYSGLRFNGLSMTLPTRWWLWPFSSPFLSWLMAMMGLACMAVMDKVTRHRARVLHQEDARLGRTHGL